MCYDLCDYFVRVTDTDGDSENSEDGDSDGSALLLRREHKKSSNTKRRYAPRLAKVGHLDFSGHTTFCTYFIAIVSQKLPFIQL